ncbi:unnamed protein product [Bursaphelenchus okinawaensis]|uniref:Uncharacterized protein n=1 Tax=Bursaphelenchus okinawaensis TaxID=465554 RepID=A0A811K9F2_9BILA|nr:unnamed protein product [Bursaphelenchus okinawaensis]CAG9094707.1 unnamed protein product [Bursaphelenchus okinawaensis]
MGVRSASIAPGPSIHRPLKSHVHDPLRRKVRPGPASLICYGLEFTLISLIFTAKLDQLQISSEEYFITLDMYVPWAVMQILPSIAQSSKLIAGGSLILHGIGVNRRVTRITFPEILAFGGWFLLLPLSLFFGESDVILLEFMMSCFLLPLTLFNLITKRKRLHRKKPNTFHSAFSVASTPTSQCSSAYLSTSRISNMNVSQVNRSRQDNLFEDSMMDTSPIRPMEREMTPFSEISGRLDSLSLGFGFGSNKDLVRDNRSSMLSKGALTPSKVSKNGGSPFKSFGGNIEPLWSGRNFSSSPPKPAFYSLTKTQSLINQPSQPFGLTKRRLDFNTFSTQTTPAPAFSIQSAPVWKSRLRSAATASTCSSTSTRRDLTKPKSNRISFKQALIGCLAAVGGVYVIKMMLDLAQSFA